MNQATIVFNDSKNFYAGTSKYDGSLEGRRKFKEDFKKVCRKVNPLAYLIVRRTIPIRKIPGDLLDGYEWDFKTHIHTWAKVSHLGRSERWALNAYTIKELIECGHIPTKTYENGAPFVDMIPMERVAELDEQESDSTSKTPPKKNQSNEEYSNFTH